MAATSPARRSMSAAAASRADLCVACACAGGVEARRCLGSGCFGCRARRLARRGVGCRLLQRGLSDGRHRRAAEPPRTGAAEAVTVAGDDDDVGVRERDIESGPPIPFDEHDAREQALDHAVEVGPARMHTLDERTRAGWDRRRCARSACECTGDEHERARVAGFDALERAAGGVAAFEHHGLEGVAEADRDRGLRAALELDVVGEGTGDAVEVGQSFGARPCARFAEREVEGIGSGAPARRFGFRLAPAFVGLRELGLGGGHSVRSVPLAGGQAGALGCNLLLGRFHLREPRLERRGLVVDFGELATKCVGVGDQRVDHALVGGGGQLALEPALLLREERAQASPTLAQRLGAHERLGGVVVAEGGERVLDVEHASVQLAQTRAHEPLLLGVLVAGVVQALEPGLPSRDLVTGQVQTDRAQLGFDAAVTPRRVGLLLERPELTGDLTDEVVEAQQIALGGFEAPLGAFPALAELEHAGRFLDDAAAVVGVGGQHLVELALADDDVLLAADPGVGQQLLDVEQAARHPVQLVLGVAVPEERARDRHLRELDRQEMGGVVDRQRNLGAAERRALRGAGEDDVVHAATAHGARALRAEDPRDGVDEVRLARPVRPHDHRHAGLELEHRLVGERLEAPQGQGLEEHPAGSPSQRIRWAIGSYPRGSRASGTSLPHAKALLPDRCPVHHVDAIDAGPPRPLTAPGHDLVDGAGRALEHDLDPAVVQVADPSRDPGCQRLVAARLPEPHPLDPTRDVDATADHLPAHGRDGDRCRRRASARPTTWLKPGRPRTRRWSGRRRAGGRSASGTAGTPRPPGRTPCGAAGTRPASR